MVKFKAHKDDYAAQEANVFLTAKTYARNGATKKQWDKLHEQVEKLKAKIWNK